MYITELRHENPVLFRSNDNLMQILKKRQRVEKNTFSYGLQEFIFWERQSQAEAERYKSLSAQPRMLKGPDSHLSLDAQ